MIFNEIDLSTNVVKTEDEGYVTVFEDDGMLGLQFTKLNILESNHYFDRKHALLLLFNILKAIYPDNNKEQTNV